MNPAITSMLEGYRLESPSDRINALREIFQDLALCGLWRARFFEHAAFYGGTALRVLYGLDRFSEDLDFSLLEPKEDFDLDPYCRAIETELSSWGFDVEVKARPRRRSSSAIESAFLKTETRQQLLVIDSASVLGEQVHGGHRLKIKLEIDTDPPPSFTTETKFLLRPIPFSVRVYDPPSLFAGKMHAVLCRRWQRRVKGRDWYDLVWYVGRKTPLDLVHLDARMRQSGHLDGASLDEQRFRSLLSERIEVLDIEAAKADVERFVVDPASVEVWSKEFFRSVAERIRFR